MADFESRVTRMTINKSGGGWGVFDDYATDVELASEGGGEFVEVSQRGSKIGIGKDEWPVIREVIDRMMESCLDEIAYALEP